MTFGYPQTPSFERLDPSQSKYFPTKGHTPARKYIFYLTRQKKKDFFVSSHLRFRRHLAYLE